MTVFCTHARVRYAETDASGIAYYGSYLLYFELGRVEMFRQLGLPYDRRLPIAETYCRYHASAVFDDLLQVETTVAQLRRCGFRLACKVFRLDGEERTLLAEGFTAMVTAGEDGRPTPLPEAFRAALASA